MNQYQAIKFIESLQQWMDEPHCIPMATIDKKAKVLATKIDAAKLPEGDVGAVCLQVRDVAALWYYRELYGMNDDALFQAIAKHPLEGILRSLVVIGEIEPGVLGENDAFLLETMLGMGDSGATADSPTSLKSIMEAAKWTIEGKHALDNLKDLGLVEASRHGHYLTAAGVKRAKQITRT
ncbi:MAG: hypothetical protein ABI557_07280 [Aureliella sp.]